MNDLDLARQLQDLYDGKIALVPNAPVDFAVAQDPDGATGLLYMGTHDITDAMHDLEALMVYTDIGRVHGGAWEGIQASLPSLPQDSLIRLRGHSLGAMRAQMAARELYRRGYRKLECVTFACPRFGDRDAVQRYQGYFSNRTYQNYSSLFEHDAFTMIPLHLILEPYIAVPNCTRFWSPPTAANEYRDFPTNIQAHSLKDCYIPGLERMAA